MLRLALSVAIILTLLLPHLALAQDEAYDGVERILDYDSRVTPGPGGEVAVIERITFNVTGAQIQHGIYRDLLTRYRNRGGKLVHLKLDVLSVNLDGAPEPYEIEHIPAGRRVKIGDAGRSVAPGKHVYEIIYTAGRALGFYGDHDELYWNVTGNGWLFNIDHASCEVQLDAGPVDKSAVKLEAWTGPAGATGTDFKAEQPAANLVRFETVTPLSQGDGLTVLVEVPKGVFAPPTASQLAAARLEEHRGDILGVAGLVLVLAYYVLMWLASGKDPAGAGPMEPTIEPPDGLPPAALRYLRSMSSDLTAFTATVMSMARKGYLSVEESARHKFTLRRGAAGDDALGEEELAVASRLFNSGDEVEIERGNQADLYSARTALDSWVRRAIGPEYHRGNTGLIVIGWLLSAGVVVVMVAQPDGFDLLLAYPWRLLIILLLGMLSLLFVKLMPAYTPLGRQLLDRIEAFRTGLAYKGQWMTPGQPPDTALYEKYLPYAIALDIEGEYGHAFQQAVEELGPGDAQQGQDYMRNPTWYVGPLGGGPYGFHGFGSSFNRSFGSSLSSASTPSSSSGGGGGSSGGGAGGGGGGGW